MYAVYVYIHASSRTCIRTYAYHVGVVVTQYTPYVYHMYTYTRHRVHTRAITRMHTHMCISCTCHHRVVHIMYVAYVYMHVPSYVCTCHRIYTHTIHVHAHDRRRVVHIMYATYVYMYVPSRVCTCHRTYTYTCSIRIHARGII
jgi:hypothetical protein